MRSSWTLAHTPTLAPHAPTQVLVADAEQALARRLLLQQGGAGSASCGGCDVLSGWGVQLDPAASAELIRVCARVCLRVSVCMFVRSWTLRPQLGSRVCACVCACVCRLSWAPA